MRLSLARTARAFRALGQAAWPLLPGGAAGSHPLGACDRVGRRPDIRGRPYVENFGRIEVGDDFRLNSRGAQSHLVTGPNGWLRIGNDVGIDFGAAIATYGGITIGDHVRIGPFVMLMDTSFHATLGHDMLLEAEPIVIGDDVRIGSRVTVLKGTVIGAGATVLAGSVVRGVVPAGQIVGGVLARPLPGGWRGSNQTQPPGT